MMGEVRVDDLSTDDGRAEEVEETERETGREGNEVRVQMGGVAACLNRPGEAAGRAEEGREISLNSGPISVPFSSSLNASSSSRSA